MGDMIYNYTKIKQRDGKLYAIGTTPIPGGVSVSFLKILIPVFLILMILFTVISVIFGINMYNFLGKSWNVTYLIVSLAISGGTGAALYNVNIAGYRLYEYLFAYFRPKKCYVIDRVFSKNTFTNIKINSLVRSEL